jgi:hypothetical protein
MAEEKGLVLDAGDGWAVVLLPGGEYKKIKTREPLAVGQFFKVRNYSMVKYATAAAIFLVIILGSLDFCRVSAWAHISPGINLGLNRWDRVISIKTNDAMGQNTIEDMPLRGQTVEQAVSNIVQKQVSTTGGWGKEAELSLTLSTRDKDKARQEELLSKIDATFKHNGGDNNPRASSVKVIRQGDKLIVIDSKINSNSGKKGGKGPKDKENHAGQGFGNINPQKSQNASEKMKADFKGQVDSSSGEKNKDKSKIETDKKKVDKVKSQPPGQQKKTKPDKKNTDYKEKS